MPLYQTGDQPPVMPSTVAWPAGEPVTTTGTPRGRSASTAASADGPARSFRLDAETT